MNLMDTLNSIKVYAIIGPIPAAICALYLHGVYKTHETPLQSDNILEQCVISCVDFLAIVVVTRDQTIGKRFANLQA